MYFSGQGVLQNHDEAAKWFWLAANQGVASAQAFSALCTPMARAFRKITSDLSAAQGGQVAAIERDSIPKLMTSAQIAEAQKLAREWRPAP
jgi:TPR repeat protein